MKNILKVLVLVAALAAAFFLFAPARWREGLFGPQGPETGAMRAHSFGRVEVFVPEAFSQDGLILDLGRGIRFSDDLAWLDPENSDREFAQFLEEAREFARSRAGDTAEELEDRDMSDLFGRPARTLCYPANGRDYTAKTFIHHLEGIVQITQSLALTKEEDPCARAEDRAFEIASKYRLGKDDAPDGSFRTRRGRLEALAETYLSAYTSFTLGSAGEGGTGDGMSLGVMFFDGVQGGDPRPPMTNTCQDMKELGIDCLEVRNGSRSTEFGLKGKESGVILTDQGKKTLFLRWENERGDGVFNSPLISLSMAAPAHLQDRALQVWDAVVFSINILP